MCFFTSPSFFPLTHRKHIKSTTPYHYYEARGVKECSYYNGMERQKKNAHRFITEKGVYAHWAKLSTTHNIPSPNMGAIFSLIGVLNICNNKVGTLLCLLVLKHAWKCLDYIIERLINMHWWPALSVIIICKFLTQETTSKHVVA